MLSSARKPPAMPMPALLTSKVTSPQRARRGGDVLGPGDVELDGLDAGQRDRGRVAGAGVDLAGAAGQRFAGEGLAEAAIGAGDEDDCVMRVSSSGSFEVG